MTIKRDQIIVVDIEATCWENKIAPPGERNEIIEVGICLLDARTYELSSKKSILAIPEHSTISPFCTQLTAITPEMVSERGLPFWQACKLLETEYDSRGRLWTSWGNYDRRLFKEQCQAMNVRYPFSDSHCNIKKLFGVFDNNKQQIGMAQALEKLSIPLEGTHHHGDDDAWNTAKILASLLTRHGIGVLAKCW